MLSFLGFFAIWVSSLCCMLRCFPCSSSNLTLAFDLSIVFEAFIVILPMTREHFCNLFLLFIGQRRQTLDQRHKARVTFMKPVYCAPKFSIIHRNAPATKLFRRWQICAHGTVRSGSPMWQRSWEGWASELSDVVLSLITIDSTSRFRIRKYSPKAAELTQSEVLFSVLEYVRVSLGSDQIAASH